MNEHSGLRKKRKRIVLIAGPTASGKSALALVLARRLDGVVVNADSMQVYREARILTARPTAEETAAAPHELYGHVSAREAYTVGRWLADAAPLLKAAREEGRPLVIVGGTGLYFTALTRGLTAIPAIPDTIRHYWRGLSEEEWPAPRLHVELTRRDSLTAARLSVNDRQRILRALEVVEATGRSLALWQESAAAPLLAPHEAIGFVLSPPRALLHARIEQRFRAMAASGGLDEARMLAALNLDPALPLMKAIGIPEMIAAARGTHALEVAIAAAVAASRRYAKRQETWFRNQMPGWIRLDPQAREGVEVHAARCLGLEQGL